MGDRCYMQLTCRAKDLKVFEELGFEAETVNPDRTIEMIDGEANYAHYDDMGKVAEKGIPFYGHHCAGGDYGPAEFASDGSGKIAWVSTGYIGGYVIDWDETCNDPELKSLEQVRNFFTVLERSKRAVLAPE